MSLIIYEFPDPYPLGVPTRVRKECDEKLDDWRKVVAPVFRIEWDRMKGDDALGTRRLLDAFLIANHVDEGLIDILLGNFVKVSTETQRLKWITVGWDYEHGWHIKIAHEVERKPDPDFREVGSGDSNACGTAAHRAILGS